MPEPGEAHSHTQNEEIRALPSSDLECLMKALLRLLAGAMVVQQEQ